MKILVQEEIWLDSTDLGYRYPRLFSTADDKRGTERLRKCYLWIMMSVFMGHQILGGFLWSWNSLSWEAVWTLLAIPIDIQVKKICIVWNEASSFSSATFSFGKNIGSNTLKQPCVKVSGHGAPRAEAFSLDHDCQSNDAATQTTADIPCFLVEMWYLREMLRKCIIT